MPVKAARAADRGLLALLGAAAAYLAFATPVEGLLDPTTVAHLNRELDPLLAQVDPAMDHLNSGVAAFFGTRVRHLCGLAGKSPTFAEAVIEVDVVAVIPS